MNMDLPVKKVRVILSDEMDRIEITLDTVTACPTMGYLPIMNMLAEQGLGQDWVRTVLKIEPEIVDLTG
jgi:hypothetical protein